MKRKQPYEPLCPLCLDPSVVSSFVFSELAKIAFGEALSSIHESCGDRAIEKLRDVSPYPGAWPAALRAGRDL